MRVVLAIHSTKLGPALGGTRYLNYERTEDAAIDALRLSRAMSYKCALAGIPAGGAKAVIAADTSGRKPPGLLATYGRFLNRVGDVFTTGEDVGFSIADREQVRAVSRFIVGTASHGQGDPGAHTAQGVLHAIEATAERLWNVNALSGLHVAVQGLGGVGFRLCERLHAKGVKLTVTDRRTETAERARLVFGAEVVDPDEIHAAPADIWSPCALGDVINDRTLGEIRVRAIVGAANNQLARHELAEALDERDILWAPDYVVSAGGIISSAEEVAQIPGRLPTVLKPLPERLQAIGARLREIYDLAVARDLTPHRAALRLAELIIGSVRAPG